MGGTVVKSESSAGLSGASLRESVQWADMGRLRYADAWALQEQLFNRSVAAKLERRALNLPNHQGSHFLLLGDHPEVFTLGRNGAEANLLVSPEKLAAEGIDFFRINRGGDITFHGPGQLVGYPILDLDCLFTDIGRYLRLIEACVIEVLDGYGLKGERLPGATGVWLDPDNPFRARKICAIGIRASRWVTMHGFALNVNTDLDRFRLIIPCGITDKAVTSLQAELGHPVPTEEVRERWLHIFSRLFEVNLTRNQDILNH
ncbi:MAG: lipoyl(octanoyl) transferase LipB [Bacteroidetes bacterium]|nr:lipoyl(octanoyl) transferase LipB [Bacteroidota bacterium]